MLSDAPCMTFPPVPGIIIGIVDLTNPTCKVANTPFRILMLRLVISGVEEPIDIHTLKEADVSETDPVLGEAVVRDEE